MTKRIKSFSATRQVEQILDDLNWGKKSAFINTAILKHVKDGEPEEKDTASERAGSRNPEGNSTAVKRLLLGSAKDQIRRAGKAEPSTAKEGSSGGNEEAKPSEKTGKRRLNQLSILLKKLETTNKKHAGGGSS